MFDTINVPPKLEVTVAGLAEAINAIVANNAKLQEMNARLIQIQKQGDLIMSKVSDYITAASGFMDRVEKGVDGLAGDVAQLKAEIETLKASLGESPTPEQLAALDALTARQEALANRVDALDAETVPPVPPSP